MSMISQREELGEWSWSRWEKGHGATGKKVMEKVDPQRASLSLYPPIPCGGVGGPGSWITGPYICMCICTHIPYMHTLYRYQEPRELCSCAGHPVSGTFIQTFTP